MPTAGAGVSVEIGWRVKVTESTAERAAPAVGAGVLFAFVGCVVVLMSRPVVYRVQRAKLCRLTSAIAASMECSSVAGKPRLL